MQDRWATTGMSVSGTSCSSSARLGALSEPSAPQVSETWSGASDSSAPKVRQKRRDWASERGGKNSNESRGDGDESGEDEPDEEGAEDDRADELDDGDDEKDDCDADPGGCDGWLMTRRLPDQWTAGRLPCQMLTVSG